MRRNRDTHGNIIHPYLIPLGFETYPLRSRGGPSQWPRDADSRHCVLKFQISADERHEDMEHGMPGDAVKLAQGGLARIRRRREDCHYGDLFRAVSGESISSPFCVSNSLSVAASVVTTSIPSASRA